ncbi:hypothetical protein Vadar_027941 [Vaccinium darrowii]|uniref:Uncharacterized protein n=1 Tax=Vaccinium darrowii TaxID=229202 RepID=A0ACB7Y994_9ERIC|nr:hypothetical protein Vadar_027941 [Vaccinium darrowii]
MQDLEDEIGDHFYLNFREIDHFYADFPQVLETLTEKYLVNLGGVELEVLGDVELEVLAESVTLIATSDAPLNNAALPLLSEVSASGLPEPVKAKIAFIEHIAISLKKQSTLSALRRILRAHKEKKCFRVIVVMPLLPGFQGGLDDSGAATVRAIMHWQYRTISRGKNSILHNLNELLGPKANDSISFYGLRTHGKLSDGGPLVTSQVYVHSKLMIIDDRVALVGSSNLNDRSLLGSRDSEVKTLIEDTEFLESSMNGVPWRAGKFALRLRLSLWSEHLGLPQEQLNRIRDPIAESSYKDLWLETANGSVVKEALGESKKSGKYQKKLGYRMKIQNVIQVVGVTGRQRKTLVENCKDNI